MTERFAQPAAGAESVERGAPAVTEAAATQAPAEAVDDAAREARAEEGPASAVQDAPEGPGHDAPAGAGAQLARLRAVQGLAVADVARQLKFAPRQIEALEADRYEALPGGAAVRGMVRSYARLLHADAAPLLEALGDRLEVPDADRLAARYGEPVPFSDNARRSTLVYAVLSAVVLVAAAGVLYEWRQDKPQAARMTFVPAAKAPLEGARAPAGAAAQRTEVASAAQSAGLGAPAGAGGAPAGDGEPAPIAAAPSVAPAAPAAAKPPAAPGGAHRIVMKFERASWVEVRDGADRVLMSKINEPGSEAVVEGEAPFSLVIGNAEHVRLTYDARPVDLAPHIRVAVARLTLP